MKLRAFRQSAEVIAAFENAHESTCAVPFRYAGHLIGHPSEDVGAEFERSERIESMGVESGGEEDELRAEAFDRRQDRIVEGALPFGVAAGRQHRQVDREPLAGSLAAFVSVAGSWVHNAWMSMQANEEHAGIGFENVLCSVSVVYVPIQNEDAFQREVVDQMLGGDGDVVEEAKTHRHPPFRVVTRGSYGAKRIVDRTGHYVVDRLQDGPGRQTGDGEALGADGAVGYVDVGTVLDACEADSLNVVGVVNSLDVLQVDRLDLDRHTRVVQPRVSQPLGDCFETLRSFRVSGPGEMLLKARILNQSRPCHLRSPRVVRIGSSMYAVCNLDTSRE